jgi:hypothetical protein
MALTTKKVVGWLQARLAEIDSQLAALQDEKAYLKGATSGLHRGAKRKTKLKELTKGKKKSLSAASRKRISVARKKAWAEVKKLGLKDLAGLKAYKAKHAKAA